MADPPTPSEARPTDPALPREDPLPGSGFGGVSESSSGPDAPSPREKNESVFELELDFVDETELDRVGRALTADVHDALEVGESTAESIPPGGKSDDDGFGEGSVTSVRRDASDDSEPVEADDEWEPMNPDEFDGVRLPAWVDGIGAGGGPGWTFGDGSGTGEVSQPWSSSILKDGMDKEDVGDEGELIGSRGTCTSSEDRPPRRQGPAEWEGRPLRSATPHTQHEHRGIRTPSANSQGVGVPAEVEAHLRKTGSDARVNGGAAVVEGVPTTWARRD